MSLPDVSNASVTTTGPFSLPAEGGPSQAVSKGSDSNTQWAADSGAGFVDRRKGGSPVRGRPERRQFGSSHSGLSEEGRELALAIDRYKVENHRRYLTCDEMLHVLSSLGYSRQPGDGSGSSNPAS